MSQLCLYVPSHVLANIARSHARQSLDVTPAQRSAVVSHQFRRARQDFAPDGAVRHAVIAAPRDVREGIAVPAPGTASRLIYDDLNRWEFDVRLVRVEGGPAVSPECVNRAYDSLGLVRQYYKEKLDRDSIDNAGARLIANVDFGTGFDNAFWDGTRMVFGNGDNVIFKDFTCDIDVPGHELTHAVTQYTAGLAYTADQTGALNESFSDIIGTAIDAWSNHRDADTHNWLIGEDIMAEDLYGEALRNMAEPGTAYDDPILGRDPQPRDMSGYYEPADPHIMSGITNRWYYLICKEIGMDAGTLIMYQTLQNLWPTAVFRDAAAVAAAQARILAENKQVPPESAQVVRAMARQQGFW